MLNYETTPYIKQHRVNSIDENQVITFPFYSEIKIVYYTNIIIDVNKWFARASVTVGVRVCFRCTSWLRSVRVPMTIFRY